MNPWHSDEGWVMAYPDESMRVIRLRPDSSRVVLRYIHPLTAVEIVLFVGTMMSALWVGAVAARSIFSSFRNKA